VRVVDLLHGSGRIEPDDEAGIDAQDRPVRFVDGLQVRRAPARLAVVECEGPVVPQIGKGRVGGAGQAQAALLEIVGLERAVAPADRTVAVQHRDGAQSISKNGAAADGFSSRAPPS
jgi:hypothetical protein